MSIRSWLNPWTRNPGTWRTNCIMPFYIRYWASADFGICGRAGAPKPIPYGPQDGSNTYKSMNICYFSSMESYYKYWFFSFNNVSLTSFHINKHKSIISFLKAEQSSIAHVCHNSFNQFQSMYIEAVYQDSFGHKWQNQIQISLCKMENLLDNVTEKLMARSRMTGSSVELSPRIDLYPSLTSTHLCFSLLPGFILSSPMLLTKQCQYVES